MFSNQEKQTRHSKPSRAGLIHSPRFYFKVYVLLCVRLRLRVCVCFCVCVFVCSGQERHSQRSSPPECQTLGGRAEVCETRTHTLSETHIEGTRYQFSFCIPQAPPCRPPPPHESQPMRSASNILINIEIPMRPSLPPCADTSCTEQSVTCLNRGIQTKFHGAWTQMLLNSLSLWSKPSLDQSAVLAQVPRSDRLEWLNPVALRTQEQNTTLHCLPQTGAGGGGEWRQLNHIPKTMDGLWSLLKL